MDAITPNNSADQCFEFKFGIPNDGNGNENENGNRNGNENGNRNENGNGNGNENENGNRNGNENENGNDGSNRKALDEMPLAMAYVPMQQWEEPYEVNTALDAGTIFPKLNLPFLGWKEWMK